MLMTRLLTLLDRFILVMAIAVNNDWLQQGLSMTLYSVVSTGYIPGIKNKLTIANCTVNPSMNKYNT